HLARFLLVPPAAGGREQPAVVAESNTVQMGVVGRHGQPLGVAQAVQVVPLPAPVLGPAVGDQLPGPARGAVLPLVVGQGGGLGRKGSSGPPSGRPLRLPSSASRPSPPVAPAPSGSPRRAISTWSPPGPGRTSAPAGPRPPPGPYSAG